MNRLPGFLLLTALAAVSGCASPGPARISQTAAPRQRTDSLPPTPNFAPKSRMAVANEARPSVALVISFDDNGRYLAHTSGFHTGAPGLVLTSEHLLTAGGSRYAVMFADHQVRPCRLIRDSNGEVMADQLSDLMWLGIETQFHRNLPPLLQMRRTAPRLAENVTLVGFGPFHQFIPDDLAALAPSMVTHGRVSGVDIDMGNPSTTFIRLSAPFCSGNSGSPILGMDGQVIGLAMGYAIDDPSQGFAVPNARILSRFGRIFASRPATRPTTTRR